VRARKKNAGIEERKNATGRKGSVNNKYRIATGGRERRNETPFPL